MTHGPVAAPTTPSAHSDAPATPSWSQPLTKLLGSGGFAAVWEVAGGTTVLKVAHADHELARARMRREADALAVIGPPAVPKLHGSGVSDDGRAWIEMDRVVGSNLADLIAAGPIRVDHAITIGDALLASLARIHAADFVHRDLKPDNLVHVRGSAVTILDLGLARKIPDDPDDPTRAGVQVGSLEYMPPEQVLDAATAGVRADIYAFGCILYELCAGRPPFVGDAMALERAHAALRPPPLSAFAAVPPPFEALVHDCLAKLPDRRPQTAIELRARLAALHDATPSLQRVQHSVSVIREGKQPVVLLWAELPKVDRTLLGMLAARKVTLISQRGRRVLGGVVGADHADPAGAAIAAARDLAAAGAKVALHLDALAVTTAPSTVISGAAVEKPEDWLPPSAWTGIVITRALGGVLQVPTRAVADMPGFVVLGEPSQTAELFGRDALVSALATDAAVALAKNGPGFALLVGDPGIGKTAIARALVPQLRELGARVHVHDIPPPGSGKPSASALVELIGTPSGPVVRAVGDAIRAAARDTPTAIILDNIHLADTDLLDALEYATLGGEPLALWILALGAPRIDQRRPGFGARSERHCRHVVQPLDEESAVTLTATLLKPAEYPPLRALRQIASLARGNPMHLTTLVREIHDRGAIRTRPNGEHFLDTTALDALPPIALGPWLAARELAHVNVELVALARVCAVLGDEIDRAELSAVVEAVERRGGATTTMDVDVGLRELETAGILVPSGGGYAFRQALLQEGIYATTNEDERRAIHAASLDYWRGRSAERVARHAEAVGEHAVAAEAFAVLGAQAQEAHHVLAADQLWSGALRHYEGRTIQRAHALINRARIRYKIQRVRDGLADLDEALAIAREHADPRTEVEALLERALGLDWTGELDASREAAELARKRAVETGTMPPEIAVDLDFADARTLFRTQQAEACAAKLRDVVARTNALERWDTRIVAGMLLGCALVDLKELDESERVFEELIAVCERVNDRVQLAASLINRAWLRTAQGQIDRLADDLRVASQLCREIGQAMYERAAMYNLAEIKLWQGELGEAMSLARRSLALQSMHGEAETHLDQLLIARIHAAEGRVEELASDLKGLASAKIVEEERATLGFLDGLLHSAPDWNALLDACASLPISYRIEMAFLASRRGGLTGARRDEMLALAKSDAIWSRRLAEF